MYDTHSRLNSCILQLALDCRFKKLVPCLPMGIDISFQSAPDLALCGLALPKLPAQPQHAPLPEVTFACVCNYQTGIRWICQHESICC